jgi:hypothetical protein
VSLFVCWVLFPLALGLLCLGCGLLVERVGGAMPSALLLPTGFAATIVVAALATTNGTTAKAATPLVGAAAAAGFVLARKRRIAVDWWAVGLAVAVFAAFGAPILLSGHATFAGYITLDDTSTFLGLTDRVMEHGRDLSGVQPSTYQRVLDVNLAHGYPVGAFMPLGIGHELVRQDIAWLFQPAIDFAAAMLGLSLYALAAPAVRSRPVRAVGLFVAAQPALLYGYSLWSGIKEVAAAALIAAAAALVATRRPIALAVVAAALLDVLGAAGAVWLVPALVAALVLLRRRALAAVAVGVVLALPAWITAGDFLRGANRGPFTSGAELGNLGRPLRFLELFGIWPAGDFRLDPTHPALAYTLIGLGIAAAAAGLWLVVRQRRAGPLVYASSAVVGLAVFAGAGSPWIAGKAYAMAAPAIALLAAIAFGAAWQRGHAIAAGAVAVLVAGGVLWSNALAYHDVWLAPRDQLRELERIGSRFAGDGPALMTEYEPYGVRHFLRRLDAEGASELRVRPVFLLDGTTLAKGAYADLDRFELPSVLVYRTLVLRRSPAESRPPSPYRLVWRGGTYEVWQRRADAAAVRRHLPLGDAVQPGAVPRCADVLALARAFPEATLVAPVRRRVIVAPFGDGYLYLTRDAAIDVVVRVPSAGRYTLWAGGSFRGELSLDVDGHRAGSRRHALNNAGQYERIGSVALTPGRHRLTLRYSGPDAHPGSGGAPFALGPVVIEPENPARMVSAPATRAGSLCGRRLDWIEAVG